MATDKIQNVPIMIHVRFKVTISLYPIPNNRARGVHAYGRQRHQRHGT